MAALCALTWGDPNATKRVFLIHGITSSSQSWHRIAQEFASRGYFVTAPDLLGHGNARRASDYTMAALAQELWPFFKTPQGDGRRYDIVIGYSLGGVVASVLLPLLKSTQPVRVVLVDPPLEQTPESVALHKAFFVDHVSHPKTPEEHLEMFPSFTKEEAIVHAANLRLCDVAAVEAILDHNRSWSFSHLLSEAPENVSIAVLAADPSKAPCARMEDVKQGPRVTAEVVWGASHLLPCEHPMAVMKTALEGTEAELVE